MTHAEPEITSETPPPKMSNPNRRQCSQVEEYDQRMNDQDRIGENRIDEGHLNKRVLRERKFLDHAPAD